MSRRVVKRGRAALVLAAAPILVLGPSNAGGAPTGASQPAAVVRPCAGGSSEVEIARQQIRALDERIEAITSAEQLKGAQEALAALIATPCLAMARAWGDRYETTSVVVFKTWWRDGGRAWLESYLRADPKRRLEFVTVPPELQESLVPGEATGEPPSPALASLLCPSGDARCGAESRGFRRRAEQAFASGQFEDCLAPPRQPPGERCAAVARTGNFDRWESCLHDYRPRLPALPLGDLRSARGGWLAVRDTSYQPQPPGQRCERAYVYHVDSGSAFAVGACDDGSGQPRREVVTGGRVSPTSIREAIFALLLADRVEWRQVNAHTERVPRGMRVQRRGEQEGFGSACARGQSHAPYLAWLWRAPGARAEGSFRLDFDPGPRYAADVLDVVAASFDPTPGTEKLPPELLDWARAKLR